MRIPVRESVGICATRRAPTPRQYASSTSCPIPRSPQHPHSSPLDPLLSTVLHRAPRIPDYPVPLYELESEVVVVPLITSSLKMMEILVNAAKTSNRIVRGASEIAIE